MDMYYRPTQTKTREQKKREMHQSSYNKEGAVIAGEGRFVNIISFQCAKKTTEYIIDQRSSQLETRYLNYD